MTMMAAPYELGQAMLAVAVQQGGDREVDNLFRSPPKTEEQQLDPWTLVADHQGFLNGAEAGAGGRREVLRRAARSAPSACCWSSPSGCPPNRR